MKQVFTLLLSLLAFCIKSSAQCDLTVLDVFPLEYQVPGTHTFDVGIRNVGTGGIGTYDIFWEQDSGPIHNVPKGAGSAPLGHVTDPSFTVSFPNAGTYTLKLWVKSVNPVDNNPSNDTFVKTIRVFSSLPKKNVVLEVFKHLACCPCYPAACYEDSVVNHNSAYSIINIYTVASDAIYNADGETVDNIYNTGHPNPLFDRFMFPYRYYLNTNFYSSGSAYALEAYGEREQYYEPVKVSFKSVTYNNTTRELKVKLDALFYDDLNGDYRFNLYLTEDSVKAYQGCAPDPNNYYHMHVLRAMLGGPWGQVGSLPTSIHMSDVKGYEFSYIMPATYNTANMRLTGLVQTFTTDTLKRRMLNSEQISFDNAMNLSAGNIIKLANDVQLYPNPAGNKLFVSFRNKVNTAYTISLFDMNGRTIISLQKNTDTEINLQTLAAGNYIIKIENGSEVYSKIIRKD